MSTHTTIRMLNEYGCSWPFFGWDSALEQDDFPLPAELSDQLLTWTRDFDMNYHEERGWPSVEHRNAAYREGLRLAQVVQEAVGPDVEITFTFWETLVNGQDLPLAG